MDAETILAAWVELGRPGARKVVQFLRKQGRRVNERQVLGVLNKQTAQQVFYAPWKSEGSIVATERNDTWQADILDNTSRNPRVNDMYRYAYIFVDVWSRRVIAVPARLKTPHMSIEAFERARRAMGRPKILETDGGGEWGGAFENECRAWGVHHVTRDPGHQNGLALVDSAIARLRRAIAKEQVDANEPTWVRPMERAAVALNKRANRHLLGESSNEIHNPTTAYALDLQAGRQILAQTRMLDRLKDRLQRAGKFRVQLSDRPKKSSNPAFSGKIHTVQSIDQTLVKDEQGNMYRIWLVRPVGGGESITLPRSVQPDEAKNDERREELRAFAEALRAHIGDGRSGVLAAAAFLRTIPGWQGRVPELLRLFPEFFEVVGRGNDISIAARS